MTPAAEGTAPPPGKNTLRNTPRTSINTIPLSTRGSPSPDWEKMDQQQRDTIFDLIDQLGRESREARGNKALSQERVVILNQETDSLRTGLINWACHGPSGPDIPQNIPLTGFQVDTLNERIRRELAYRGLPMITPIPRPPPPTSSIPPLQPPVPKATYYPITGTFDKSGPQPPRPTNDEPGAPPERSDWSPPPQPPSDRRQSAPTTSTRNYPPIPCKEDGPLFRRDITHSAELPPTYPNPNTTSSTVYVHNADPPPRGQAWKTGFTKAFDRYSSTNPDPRLRLTLRSVSYAPHYPNMLCLRVIHSPGLENSDLLHGIRGIAKRGFFGEGNINFSIARTFTDIIVTFGQESPSHHHKLRRQRRISPNS